MIAVPREADAIRLLKRESTQPVNEERRNNALTKNNVVDAYAVKDKSVDALVGGAGRQFDWEGGELGQPLA